MSAIGLRVHLACTWEATARKAGNVHPYAAFANLDYNDFLVASATIAQSLSLSSLSCWVGHRISDAVRRTRNVARGNVNLGMILLLAPLAQAARTTDMRRLLPGLLDRIELRETAVVYRAIRLAAPGGLGRTTEQDVGAEPTVPLRQAMALAADG